MISGSIDSIRNFNLKKKAVEAILNEGAGNEIIAERLIMILDGNEDLLDYLISGVPYDIKDPENRLRLEKYLRDRMNIRLESLDSIEISSTSVNVKYHCTARTWLKDGDEESAIQLHSGNVSIYDVPHNYSMSQEFPMLCDYSTRGNSEIHISDLIEYGVEFKRL